MEIYNYPWPLKRPMKEENRSWLIDNTETSPCSAPYKDAVIPGVYYWPDGITQTGTWIVHYHLHGMYARGWMRPRDPCYGSTPEECRIKMLKALVKDPHVLPRDICETAALLLEVYER